jgi:CYTH domain-containing protein/predicted ATPase
MAPVHRIVLTGGPCGGKTTALTRITERMQDLGFRVLRVPEVPTLLLLGGATLDGVTLEQFIAFETSVLETQIALEDGFLRVAAASDQPCVVVYDRGLLDVSAYLPDSAWRSLLDDHGWSVVALRDRRYDAVIHMVTAADGAEGFYTTANNAARRETPAQARDLDARLREAWVGHPHLRVIDNSTDFAAKVARVVQAMCRVVGVPAPLEIERKFLLRRAPGPLPLRAEEIEIEQTYLATADGSQARVRRRGQHGSHIYLHTIKRPLVAGQQIEVEHAVSGREYLSLLTRADPARHPIRKRRTCFLWRGHYFELDVFADPHAGLAVLEVELEQPDAEVELPPFVDVEREVTGDPAYSNYLMAARS